MRSLVVQPLTFPAPAEALRHRAHGERLAAIDIGTNSIHMIVAAAESDGGYQVLGREREMVQLGKSGLGDGALSEAAMRDGLEALVKMTTLARLKGADRVVAVATSAVREAANGADFLARLRAQTGLDVQLLTGEEEGRLIFRAVREVVDLGTGSAVVLDVGGGSTEWITVASGEIQEVMSLSLGSLRCAASLEGDPPTPASLERLRRRIEKRLGRELEHRKAERLVATSGTAVCCADLIDWFQPGPRRTVSGSLREVRTKDLAQLVVRLGGMKRKSIADLPPVGGPRSDSLLAGAVLLHALVAHAGVDRFQVCDWALREGLVLASLSRSVSGDQQPADLRRRQVLRLAERTPSVLGHNQQTAQLAVRLFDLTASLHGFGAREREWLEHAALLHDVGYSIHYKGHHKHAYYLITHAALDGFDQREVEILAHLARYHRGARPKASHPALAALEPWQRRTVRRLTALLRLADALDRTHASRVDEIYCAITKQRVTLEVVSRWDVDLELAAAREHGPYFARVFGRKLRLRQGLEVAQG